MNSKFLTLYSLATLLFLSGCSKPSQEATPTALTPCSNEATIEYLCGPENAEDALRLGDSQWLIVSGMNGDLSGDSLNGKLHLVNHKDKTYEIIFPGDSPVLAQDMTMFADCPAPMDITNISMHGLALQNLEQGSDQYRLYVTSHGAREAVEVFELDASSTPEIKWVGCVPMPETSWTNSLTLLDDGGFYATQFMDPTGSGMAGVAAGEITGHVFEWHPGEDVKVLAGTELSGPNGIAISDDERWLYVAAFGTHEVIRFDTSTSPISKDSVEISLAPDNLRWTSNGTLYTAGGYITEDCPGPECGIGWGVFEIDPDSLEAWHVTGVDQTAAMKGASSALLVDDEIWISTYSGDRIGILAKVDRPTSQLNKSAEIKLYIFDNGSIDGLDPALFNFSADEVASTDFVVTSNLIVHPNGLLLWESGMIPDDEFPADGSPAVDDVSVATITLRSQLAEIGYSAEDIDYFAMSHLHSDHNGNANEYAGSQWIVQRADRDMMFASEEQQLMVVDHYDALETAETTILDNEDYDVFGDGSVMILAAPGHTPGHQVLLVNLPNNGSILLAGDLYHYPEEITTGRFPTFEFDPSISAGSRAKIAAIVEENSAIMWIGHDKPTHQALNFSPAYYD